MTVGIHLILDVFDIPNNELLKYLDNNKQKLDTIIEKLTLTVVNESGYQFSPIGYTYAYVLSESHMTIHTYPEKNSCYIDIFCCNSSFNPDKAIDIIKGIFSSNNIKHTILYR